MKIEWAAGYCKFPQLSFRRLFRQVKRPVPDDAAIVTAYTNGEVTLRSNRRLEGYHEATDLFAFQGVKVGDFVVHGLDILRGSIGVSDSFGAISSVCAVCTPIKDAEPRFFAYVMRAQASSGFPRAMARGVREGGADFRRWDTLGDLPLPVPSGPEQRAIVNILDIETTRIDTLISKKRQMIDLLELRFWALIESMSLGAEADYVPLRRALVSIVDGPFGSAFSSADYTSSGAAVVRLGNIGFAEYRPHRQVYIPARLFEKFLRHRVGKGDLLIAGLGDDSNHAGRACVAPDLGDAIVKGKCFSARVAPSRASARYLAYILSSPAGAEAVGLSARGSTRSMINLDIIKSTIIPLPSVEVQRSIADLADIARLRAGPIVNALERQIALLRERRQALITAAVTGEMDVPGVST
ncbi:MAG: hypothetical protein ACRDSG_19720 [Pseudonocardiaceae bacterium]